MSNTLPESRGAKSHPLYHRLCALWRFRPPGGGDYVLRPVGHLQHVRGPGGELASDVSHLRVGPLYHVCAVYFPDRPARFPPLNDAAAKGTLRQRALKIFTIEGGIGLVSLILMGVLAVMGYPPAF